LLIINYYGLSVRYMLFRVIFELCFRYDFSV